MFVKRAAAHLHPGVLRLGLTVILVNRTVILLGVLVIHLAVAEIVLDLLGVSVLLVVVLIALGVDTLLQFVKDSHVTNPPNFIGFFPL